MADAVLLGSPTISLVLATSTGGVGAHVRALARGLTEAGWQVRVCGPAGTEDLFGFTKVGAQFAPVAITGAATAGAAVVELRRASAGSQLVHAHGLRAGAVAAVAGRRPLVVTWHNAILDSTSGARTLLTAMERLVARRATVSLAASADLARRAHDLGGHDVRDAPVAVNLAEPLRSAASVRAELGVAPGQYLVLAIGRLHPQKGLDVLITAAARWSPTEIAVVVAGEGPLRRALAEQIERTGAPVRLLGRRTDIADLVTAADLVVLPSRWEARSLAAQEVLHAGRPLVATAVGGLPELVGDAAVLVPPDEPDAIDSAVQELLADPDRRARLCARALSRAATWPTEADTLGQVIAVYEELLGWR